MKVNIIGGGPAGLYLSILLKTASAKNEVTVYERNRVDDTFGFGVVFSDQTLGNLREADRDTYFEIIKSFARWDDIHIHYQGEIVRSTGHGFAGLARKQLLQLLAVRALKLGVDLRFETEVADIEALRDADLLVGADGVSSLVRERYADHFKPTIDWRPNRFTWLGTTFPFNAFTFYFKYDVHGLWRVHAYRYADDASTFIVECTDDTAHRANLDDATEEEIRAYCEHLFADELVGHALLANRSIWRRFPTIKNERWSHENVVLIGDAVHTAHFSIGSGTKLAMEDSIDLARELVIHGGDVGVALKQYEADRKGAIASTQRAAQVSLEWFENTERYMDLQPKQFAFSLLTRSMRVTHENLALRDRSLMDDVDTWFADGAQSQSGLQVLRDPKPPPPMFTPFRLRDMVLDNRVVMSPMCMYSASDGTIDDWHLVHLGSRAVGGAGLIITEMTDVSADGRITPGCAGMYQPAHVGAWKRVTDFVHRYSGAKIGLQLAHAGRKGATKLMWQGIDQPLEDGDWPIISASPLPYLQGSQRPKEMDCADMDRVRADFVRAANMADEAGFDMLELHFAHGYLLSTFLSPLTNKRIDEYGGAFVNRVRYPIEILEAVRAAWPDHKPISVRISATDWAPDGFVVADAVKLARLLSRRGADIIDVSSGMTVREAQPQYGRLFQTPFAEQVRLEANVPTMAVGNIQSYSDVNTILAAGRADLCVLARAHLYDPYWTRHAAKHVGYDLKWPDQYSAIQRYNPRFE